MAEDRPGREHNLRPAPPLKGSSWIEYAAKVHPLTFHQMQPVALPTVTSAIGPNPPHRKFQYHRSPYRSSTALLSNQWHSGIANQVLGVIGGLKLSQGENPVCFWISVRRSDSFE